MIPEKYYESYKELQSIEGALELLQNDIDGSLEKEIKSFRRFIYDVLDKIRELAFYNDLDDVLSFHFGYNLEEIIDKSHKNIEKFNNKILEIKGEKL